MADVEILGCVEYSFVLTTQYSETELSIRFLLPGTGF